MRKVFRMFGFVMIAPVLFVLLMVVLVLALVSAVADQLLLMLGRVVGIQMPKQKSPPMFEIKSSGQGERE